MTLGRTEVGQLTTDGLPDAVVAADGKLYLCYGPALYDYVGQIGSFTTTDFAILEGSGENGQDGLVVATSTGIDRWWHESATNTWTSASLGGGEADARRIRVGDIDDDGSLDVVSLSSDGLTLSFVKDIPTTPVETTLTLPAESVDFVLLNITGNDELEIAIMTASSGTKILEEDGTEVMSFLLGQTGDLLGVIRDSSSTYDRLPAVVKVNGTQYLTVTDYTGTEQAILAGTDISVLATGDLGNDGNDEVVFSRVADQNPRELFNRAPTTTTFSRIVGQTLEFVPATPIQNSPGNVAWPVIADIDLDGDNDMLYPEQLGQKVTYLENDVVDASSLEPVVISATLNFNLQLMEGDLGILFDNPFHDQGNSLEIRAIAWYAAGAGLPISDTATANVVSDPAGEGDEQVPIWIEDLPVVVGSDDVYWVHVTTFEKDNGQIVSQSPPVMYVFYVGQDTETVYTSPPFTITTGVLLDDGNGGGSGVNLGISQSGTGPGNGGMEPDPDP